MPSASIRRPSTRRSTVQHGLPLERKLVDALKRHGLNRKHAPVFIQSFEQSNLKQLNTMTPVQLSQLVDAKDVNLDGSLDYAETSDRAVRLDRLRRPAARSPARSATSPRTPA